MDFLATVEDPRPGAYYVSVIRRQSEYRLLLGPFKTHKEALARVRECRLYACLVDDRCIEQGYAFGTCRVANEEAGLQGIFNDELGLSNYCRDHGIDW